LLEAAPYEESKISIGRAKVLLIIMLISGRHGSNRLLSEQLDVASVLVSVLRMERPEHLCRIANILGTENYENYIKSAFPLSGIIDGFKLPV
jgi:hypothetical protein